MLKRLFTRIYQSPPPVVLHAAFNDYIAWKNEFSERRMGLSDHRLTAEQLKKPVDVTQIWRDLDTQAMTGRNMLVKTAVHLLSIVPNSAGAERAFSQMGLIHTRSRNRLHVQKVHKMVMVRMNLKRAHEDQLDQRRKRRFEEPTIDLDSRPATPPVPTPPAPETTTSDMPPVAPNITPVDEDPDAPEDGLYLREDETFTAAMDAFLEANEDSAASGDVADTDGEWAGAIGGESTDEEAEEVSEGISERTALELGNIFDFEAIGDHGAAIWQTGSDSLAAETLLYDFMASGGETDVLDE